MVIACTCASVSVSTNPHDVAFRSDDHAIEQVPEGEPHDEAVRLADLRTDDVGIGARGVLRWGVALDVDVRAAVGGVGVDPQT